MTKRYLSIDESMVGMKNRHISSTWPTNDTPGMVSKSLNCAMPRQDIYYVFLHSGQDFDIRGAEGQASAIVNHLLVVCGVCGKRYHVVTY